MKTELKQRDVKVEQLHKEGEKFRESLQQKIGQLQQKENESQMKEDELGRLHVELQQRNDKILQMNEDIKHKASQIDAIQDEIEVSIIIVYMHKITIHYNKTSLKWPCCFITQSLSALKYNIVL